MADERPGRVVVTMQAADEVVRRPIQEQFWKRMHERQAVDGGGRREKGAEVAVGSREGTGGDSRVSTLPIFAQDE